MGRVNGNQKEPGSIPEPEHVDTLLPFSPKGQGRERVAAPIEDIFSARAVPAIKAHTGYTGTVREVLGHLPFPLMHCSLSNSSH